MQPKHWSMQKLAMAALTAVMFVASLAPAAAQGRPEILWMHGTAPFHTGNIFLSPNGAFVISGDHDGIRIWKTHDVSLMRTIPVGISGVNFRYRVSLDGKHLAVSVGTYTRVFRLPEGQLVGSVNSLLGPVAISPDNQFIVTIWIDDTLRFWRLSDGSVAFSLSGAVEVKELTFSPDGRYLAATCGDSRVRVWELPSGNLRYNWSIPETPEKVLFTPQNNQVVVGASHQGICKVYVWNVHNGSLQRTITVQSTYKMSQMAILQGGSMVALGMSATTEMNAPPNDTTIKIYDLSSGTLVRSFGNIYVHDLAASAYNDALVVLGTRIDGYNTDPCTGTAFPRRIVAIEVWRPSIARKIHDMGGLLRYGIAISPDGSFVAYARDNTVQICRGSDGTMLQEVVVEDANGTPPITSLGISHNGSLLAIGSRTRGRYFVQPTECRYIQIDKLQIWRLSDNSVLRSLYGEQEPAEVRQVLFTSDSSLMITAITAIQFQSQDGYTYVHSKGYIDIWRTSDWTRLRRIENLSYRGSRAIALSPDGTLLAFEDLTTSSDSIIRFARLADGAEIGRITLSISGEFASLAFSPDGTLLAAGSTDGRARLWRVSSRTLIRTHEQPSYVYPISYGVQVAFSRDGLILVSGGTDMRFWRVSDGTLERLYDQEIGVVHRLMFADGLFAYSRWDDVVVVARYTGRRIRLPVPATIR